jgi:serine/threonine-protein kinase
VTRNAAAEAELLRRLPDGYPPGACTAVGPDQGARATVTCTANRDRGGPSTSRYSLMPDRDALQRAFDTIVSQSTVQICPGNIMSPGAWRHNATPDQVAGTVFCGAQGASPLVGWTSDDQLLLNIANSAANGPTLDQLYAWWSTHS